MHPQPRGEQAVPKAASYQRHGVGEFTDACGRVNHNDLYFIQPNAGKGELVTKSGAAQADGQVRGTKRRQRRHRGGTVARGVIWEAEMAAAISSKEQRSSRGPPRRRPRYRR